MKPIRAKSLAEITSLVLATDWYKDAKKEYDDHCERIEQMKKNGEYIDRDLWEEKIILKGQQKIENMMPIETLVRHRNNGRAGWYNPGGHHLLVCRDGYFKGEPYHFFTFYLR